MRFRQTLFWDVNPRTIDPDKNARYVIARILDFGNDREVRWMFQKYPLETIRSELLRSRCSTNEHARLFWLLAIAMMEAMPSIRKIFGLDAALPSVTRSKARTATLVDRRGPWPGSAG